MTISRIIQNALHYITLPEAAGLFCILTFMLGERRRGKLMFLGLSASVSFCLLLKEIFKIPQSLLIFAEKPPFPAEGGYAMPCLHCMMITALLCLFARSTGDRRIRSICILGICLTAFFRVYHGLQTVTDVLLGIAGGLICAVFLYHFYYWSTKNISRYITAAVVLLFSIAAAVITEEGWGTGTWLTALFLSLPERLFEKAEPSQTAFGKIYGAVLAAGIYAGLIIFLPFLVEWFVTPRWPGQTLIVFLITLLPCLLRLFPIF